MKIEKTALLPVSADEAFAPRGPPGARGASRAGPGRRSSEPPSRLRSAGVDVGELLLWTGAPPMFGSADPDGNRLYLVEQG